MNKESFRKEALLIRKSIPETLRKDKSIKICEEVLELDEYKNAKTVMLYMSYRSEVETDTIIKRAFSDAKRVVLPYCIPGTDEMIACEIFEGEELKKGSFGIKEPQQDNKVLEDEIDFVLVPGVAFDKNGKRMGYGRGFYDRFLPKLRKNCFVCGVTFAETLFENVPANKYDFVMKKVVTA